MAIKEEIKKKAIDDLAIKDDYKLGNGKLYEMCKEYPKHDDEQIIKNKMWLIGRAYAVAIERRKTNLGKTYEEYMDIVGKKIKKYGSELDSKIIELNKFKEINVESIEKSIGAQKYLMDIFHEITDMDKRSLASKYLHFHAPKIVFIYDSRAVAAAKKIADGKNKLQEAIKDIGFKDKDDEYCKLSEKLFDIYEYINCKYKKRLTPRDIDRFLLKY